MFQTIKKLLVIALLYWAAADKEPSTNGDNQPSWNYNDVKLMLPGQTSYTTVTADETIYRGRDFHFSNDPYICVKDITSDVIGLSDPYGTYQVANVEAKTGSLESHGGGNTGTSGGWQIVFVYESPKLPAKNISLFDGYAHLFTPDLFTDNIMAPRINVRIKDLSSFQELNQKFTFGAYISTSYEVTSYYLKDSLEILSEFNSNSFIPTNNNQLEEKYLLTLTSSNCSLPSREIIDTIKYIRLRRNLFTHLSDTISTPLNALIVNQGTNLNTFWRTALTELDFTNSDVLNFKEAETIDLLKILRIIVETLDINLANNLSTDGMITYLAKKQFESKPQRINADIIEQRIRKIKKVGMAVFGVTLIESEIEPIVKVIGKR